MKAMTRPSESRAERRKRETRERLLDAALKVFLERGFDAATTAEMATAADVGAGTFYLHFRDKRDVYETISRRAAREMIARWRAKLQPRLGYGGLSIHHSRLLGISSEMKNCYRVVLAIGAI